MTFNAGASGAQAVSYFILPIVHYAALIALHD